MMTPQFSVIIPTLGRRESLKRTLECLSKSTITDFEAIVVDQNKGKPDIQTLFPDSRFRRIELSRANLPLARNRGLIKAKAPLILFLDDDITFGPEFTAAHLAGHRAHPEAGAVTGRIRLAPPHFYPDKDCLAEIDPGTARFRVNFDQPLPAKTDFFSGGNVSLKRSAIDKTGRFDTAYLRNALYEEIDFALRLRQQGFEILFWPEAEVVHWRDAEGGCRNDHGRKYFFYKFYNTAYFYTKQLFHGNPMPFLKAMKNEIEFYSRTKTGRSWLSVACYFMGLKLGAVRGLINRIF